MYLRFQPFGGHAFPASSTLHFARVVLCTLLTTLSHFLRPLHSVGCGDTIGAIPTPAYRALEGALKDKTKAERDLKMYTNLVSYSQSFHAVMTQL